MSLTARREYFASIWERYRKANREEKSQILDEFCKVCGYSRNYAIRKLKGPIQPRLRRASGRRPTYDASFVRVLHELWLAMHRMCSKKMVAALPHWLGYGEFDPDLKVKLLGVSAATIDRLLRPYREKKIRGKNLTGKGAHRFIKRVIPLKRLDQEYKKPGFMQADTVGHCGDDISGFYAFSLTMTDIDSTWTENRAIWCKNAFFVAQAIEDIEHLLPFKIYGYSADNGNEVLNERIYDYFQKRPVGERVEVTRGRPYRKNDQCYVEQKNNSHVRGIFGYERIDERSLIEKMNTIYTIWNQLTNFFIPSMKCIEKKREGARIVKKYDEPRTPYQRLLESSDIDQQAKQRLRSRHSGLDPFLLSQELEKERRAFFSLLRRLKQGQVA